MWGGREPASGAREAHGPDLAARGCVPTDTASVQAARQCGGFEQGEMRSTRLLMPLVPAVFVKYLTPGLLFIASKPR